MEPLKKQWKAVKSDYKLIEVLGVGSFGTVVKAKKRTTKEVVAIKCINIDPNRIQDLRYIVREIQILRQLSQFSMHNIFTTKLHDIIIPDETDPDLSNLSHIFLVIDYFEADLKQALIDTAPKNFQKDHVVTLIYNLLCALNFLHTAGVVHRDIKPANILVNNYCSVKLCDFGISRTLTQRQKTPDRLVDTQYLSKQLVQTRNFSNQDTNDVRERQSRFSGDGKEIKRDLSSHVQSRWYRAPEVILQEPHYDTKIDMWSMGCLLGEINRKLSPPKQADKKQSNVLFRGKSCYPLTPSREMIESDKIVIEKDDQLFKIISNLGHQSQDSLDFISSKSAMAYVQKVNNKTGKKQNQILEHGSQLDDLISKMIEFNPNKRWSAKECLSHQLFDNYRCQQLEKPAPFKIVCHDDFQFVETPESRQQYKNKHLQLLQQEIGHFIQK